MPAEKRRHTAGNLCSQARFTGLCEGAASPCTYLSPICRIQTKDLRELKQEQTKFFIRSEEPDTTRFVAASPLISDVIDAESPRCRKPYWIVSSETNDPTAASNFDALISFPSLSTPQQRSCKEEKRGSYTLPYTRRRILCSAKNKTAVNQIKA